MYFEYNKLGDKMDYSINPQKVPQLIYLDAYLIDIRDKYQFDDLHIKNFINIPYEHFSSYLPTLSKNKPIYFICQSGQKAKELVLQLRQNHYQAYYIDGGFQAFISIPPIKYY